MIHEFPCGCNIADEPQPSVWRRCPLHAAAEKLLAALRRIEHWQGEFPETGKTWQDGTPMSYGAAFGSNGERDFMRAIARSAIAHAESREEAVSGDWENLTERL